MSVRKIPGLIQRGAIWHFDKVVRGRRLCGSTGTGDLREAEAVLAQRIAAALSEDKTALTRVRTFRDAATRFLTDETKSSLDRDAATLKLAVPWIGTLPLSQVHDGTLQPFKQARLAAGRAPGTVNRDLAVIRRVLVLAARAWRDELGQPWLTTVPLLRMLPATPQPPYPISYDEQDRLLAALPPHLSRMALFALHTGMRDNEFCGLRWDELRPDGHIVLDEKRTKNGKSRLVVVNRTARTVLAQCRTAADYVFLYEGHPIGRMNNHGWRTARVAAGLPTLRVHDLRHTFGMRLRALDVSQEDRADLLGHHQGHITTHYSRAEVAGLLRCVELLNEAPALTVVRA